ncbi:unnamed protein product, partial [Brassica rapa subsp. trilocularis]
CVQQQATRPLLKTMQNSFPSPRTGGTASLVGRFDANDVALLEQNEVPPLCSSGYVLLL